MKRVAWGAAFAALLSFVAFSSPSAAADPPQFQVDPFWPKPLPNNWLFGQIGGLAVDSNDHVWVLQRPRSLTEDERGATLKPPRNNCCVPAPSVLEFDADGNFVQGWGGPGTGDEWVGREHGIFVDHKGFVWLGGNADTDSAIFKYTKNGKLVMEIGKIGPSKGSNDTTMLGKPADIQVDPATNEVFVADGYGNRRVIGLVYVCDRTNNRIQVFKKDGTYVTEWFYDKNTLGNGAVWDLNFWPDAGQTYLLNIDGENNQLRVLKRSDGSVVGTVGRSGRYAGQFHWVHNINVDSKGNVYTGEVDNANRVQKFKPTSAP
jgi:DNA-binding beta-propeller fold protein YncE